jgi:hypothetical protein
VIQSLHVENFRCFKSLQLSGLRRINVLVGQNASGKTVLLEAIKIGLNGTPAIVPWLNQNRQIFTAFPQNPTSEQFRAYFLDLFSEFNANKPISFEIYDSDNRIAKLRVRFDPERATTVQPALGFQPSTTPAPPPSTIVPLVFERVDFQGQNSTLVATVQPQGQILLPPGSEMGIVSGFFSSASYGVPFENATWFSNLSIEKREGEVIEALRRHFPVIHGITSETLMPGVATIYADISGLPRKLPLSLVSGGISRLFTLLLAVITFRRGVVLVDEIENGLFHNQHPRMWKTITDLAIQYDTQLFVSTHSKECLQSALSAVTAQPDAFNLLRIRRDKADTQSIVEVFNGEQFEAALDKNGEVRD